MAEENKHPLDQDFRMSGAGKGFGTDPLDLSDLTPKQPELPPMSPALTNYLADNGMLDSLPPEYQLPQPSSQSIKDLMVAAQVNGVGAMQDPFKLGKQNMFDGRNPNLPHQFYERYTNHISFDELGFSPFKDNETLYNENSSAFDDFKRAAGQWTTLTGLGFKDAAGWFGDLTDPITADKYERAMAIGSSTRGGFAGFMNNLFLNSGYTVGIMGELALEELLMLSAEAGMGIGTVGSLGAAAPVTGPAMAATGSTMVSRAIRAGSKIAQSWKKAGKLAKTMDSFKDISKAREYFTKGAIATGKFFNPLDNTVDFFRNIDNFKDLNNLQKTTKGFGEFYRDVRNVRLAYGEASLEGGMVQNSMERDLLADFKAKNGRPPTDAEAEQIKQTAAAAGTTTTLINAPVIMLSNKVTLPGLTGGAMKRLGSDVITAGAGRKMIFNARNFLKNGGDAFTALPKNYFKAKWHYIKNPRLMATNALKYGEANWMEGIQELAQETFASASEEYYTAKYNGDAMRGGYMSAMLNNLGGGHGAGAAFETFLSGFLMGGMTAPLSMVTTAAMRGKKGFEGTLAGNIGGKIHQQGMKMRYGKDSAKYQEYAARQKKIETDRETALNNDVNMLNELYKDPNHYFSPAMENLMEQKEYRKAMQLAEKNNDSRTYYDMKDSSAIKHITTALKYGHLDTMIERLSDFTKMTAEETADIRGSLSHEQFQKEVGKSITQAENIRTMWNTATRKYPNPINPHKYKYMSDEYQLAAIDHDAWNKAIEEMVFNQASFARSLARQKSILGSAKEVAGLENTSYADFNVLFVQKDGQAELDTLTKEIKGLEEAELITPEAKKIYKEKTEKKEKLEKVLNAIQEVIKNTNENEQIDKKDYANVKKAYTEYLQFIANKNGDFTNADKLDESLKQLLDYNLLGQRSIAANNAVNTLLDPKNFLNRFERIKALNDVLYENRKEEIRKSLTEFQKIKDTNNMLNELYNEGMFFDPGDLEALEKEGIVPNTFYYHEDGNVSEVPMTKADYKKAVGILKKHLKNKGIDVENIDIAENFNPYSAHSRRKSKGDERQYKDYAEQFGFDPEAESSEVPLKQVLQAIIDSEYATDREVALAEKMLEIADDKEVVTFSKKEKSPGLYSESRGVVIDPRYNSYEYKQGRNGHPIEHVILHEEIHRRTVESLANDKEFRDEMTKLMNEANDFFNKLGPRERIMLTGDPMKSLYGLANIQEFVAEAMSNDNFQRFLAMIKTDTKTSKSSWEKFVDLVLDSIEKLLGQRVNGTVLNAAMDIITARIDTMFGEGIATEAPKTTGTTAGLVSATTPINELKIQHNKLYEDLLTLYIEDQNWRKSEGLDYWQEIEGKTREQIGSSVQFKNFLKSNGKATTAIVRYNRNLTAQAQAAGTTTAPAQVTTDVTDQEYNEFKDNGTITDRRKSIIFNKKRNNSKLSNQEEEMYESISEEIDDMLKEDLGNHKTKNDVFKKQLRALGYTRGEIKNMPLNRGNQLIKEGIHKQDRAAAEAAAKAKVDPALEAEAKELREFVENKIAEITDLSTYEAHKAELHAIVGSDPRYKNLAGIDGKTLVEMLEAKLDELAFSITFDNINVDDAVIINNKYGTQAIVIAKGEDYITVEYQSKGNKVYNISKDKVEEKIKFKYSEAFEQSYKDEKVEVTPEEKILAAQTVENAIGLEGIGEDIKTAEEQTKENRDNDLLDSICK